MPQARQQPTSPTAQFALAEAVREGSRWINGRPSGEDFGSWFKDNVTLHDGMDAEKYVTGITLISGTEKRKVARVATDGTIVNVEEERLTHTPYAKVETRVAYFWDYMALHEEWVGCIEAAPIVGGGAEGLPPGFFRMAIQKPDSKVVNFVCCSMMVRILRADSVKTLTVEKGSPRMGREKQTVTEGIPVAVFPAATKMIPTVNRYGDEDPFAVMKAETGAVGRALGMAGMLVIPGSGVATAEDMIEAQTHEPSLGGNLDTGQAEAAATGLAAANQTQDLRLEIGTMIEQLEVDAPGKLEEIRNWAKERRLNLNELSEQALRGVHKKLSDALAS